MSGAHSSRQRTAALAAVALAAGAAVVGAAPAQAAAPLERDHYSGSWSEEYEDCGYRFAAEGEYSGTFVERTSRRFPLSVAFEQYRFDTTYTNLDTGVSFTTSARGMTRDTSVVDAGDGLYVITFTDSGSAFTVRAEDGSTYYRIRGITTFELVLDTKGDDDPDNDDYLSIEVVDSRGPNVEETTFCEDALALTT